MVVWAYGLLDLGLVEFPDRFRDTQPVALVLTLSVWLSSITIASTALYREKVAGTLERLSVTPFRPVQLVVAKSLVLGITGFLQATVVLTAALAFVPEELGRARALELLAVLAAVAFAAVALGIALSALLNSSAQLSNAVTFLTLGFLTLSGFFKPLDDLGGFGRFAGYGSFALGYAALQRMVEEGEFLGANVLLLAAEGVALVGLALLGLRLSAGARVEP